MFNWFVQLFQHHEVGDVAGQVGTNPTSLPKLFFVAKAQSPATNGPEVHLHPVFEIRNLRIHLGR